jgi:HPt (histidine-containing phosphotransfer) domain-containing protein
MTVLDESYLDALRALGKEPGEVLAYMLESFLAEGPRLLAEIEAAVAAGDFAVSGPTAHSLKGISGQAGAHLVAEVCAALQEGAPPPGAAPITDTVAALRRETDRALSEASLVLSELGR